MAKQTAESEEEWLWRVTEDLRRTLGDEASIDDDLAHLAETASYRITELEDACSPKKGAEAEELRAGIEKLLSSIGKSSDETEVWDAFEKGLRRLLDEVDARDSLKWLEDYDKMEKVLVRAAAQLQAGGRIVASSQVGQEIGRVAGKLADRRLVQAINGVKKKELCRPKSTSASKSKTKTTPSSK